MKLKSFEKSAFRASFSPWLLDIFLSGMIVMIALFFSHATEAKDDGLSGLIAFSLAVFVWVACFKLVQTHLVKPRIGYAKFGPARRARMRNAKNVLIGSVAIGLLILLLTIASMRMTIGIPSGVLLFGLFGLKAIIVFGLMAWLLDYPQGFLWGWLFALAIPTIELGRNLLGLEFPLFPLLAGLSMAIHGLLGMRRFLKNYPQIDRSGSPIVNNIL